MKNRKGFTLIELLAVIVILGLLMAIAIPSVTKYITESRKKTLTTTLGNYIGALVNEVNDLSYTFTGQNTIYAVPIECIALERGGTNPFGHWYQANDAYFAYVLIQYDDVNSKYVYGFTFKDSAGYGLYPTIQGNINEKGSQVKTGYDLKKPETGELTSLTTLSKWQESGFKVDSTTNFQVLEATSENEVGNGTSTCTLQQKGENYAQVEEEKVNSTQVCTGNGTNIGDIVKCGSEEFYVIDSDSSNVIMFTKYAIDLSLFRQSLTAENDRFVTRGTSGYWRNPNLLPQYGDSYPAYIYDSNSNIYKYVEGYKNFLINTLKLDVVSARLISREQLQKLGCGVGEYDTCSGAPQWVYSVGYWTGYTWSGNEVSYVDMGGNVGLDDYTYGWPVRPVITIPKSYIKF